MPRLFDRKFKIRSKDIPDGPGVYFFEDEAGTVLYVGKAKSLRKRLGQYRNLSRKKKDRKRTRIVRQASKLRWERTATAVDAALQELEWIQRLRPALNVEGAYFFLYPYLGFHYADGDLCLCYSPEPQGDYRYFGAFRSRQVTREAFEGLLELMGYLFHPLERKRVGKVTCAPYTRRGGFRRVPEAWVARIEGFLRGRDRDLLDHLWSELLEKPAARQSGAEIKEALRAVDRFRRWEITELERAIDVSGFPRYPVPQLDRDRIFLHYRSGHEVNGEVERDEEVPGREPSL